MLPLEALWGRPSYKVRSVFEVGSSKATTATWTSCSLAFRLLFAQTGLSLSEAANCRLRFGHAEPDTDSDSESSAAASRVRRPDELRRSRASYRASVADPCDTSDPLEAAPGASWDASRGLPLDSTVPASLKANALRNLRES